MSPVQSKGRQRRERVIDQMILKCLLQSTTKIRILLHRQKAYVSLHMFGSFPKASYQSFSLVFNSEPLHLAVLSRSLHLVRAGGSSCSTNSPSPSSDQRHLSAWSIHMWHKAQLTDGKRRYGEKICVPAPVAASVLSAISRLRRKGHQDSMSFCQL